MKATLNPAFLLTWESQAEQYPPSGPAGISYFAGEVDGMPPVDCLLFRGEDGGLRGILNHYSVDYPPWEKAGNYNLWVHPVHQRQGVGLALLHAANVRWRLNFEQQRYTPDGLALAERYLAVRHALA